ncbi:MAG: NAD(P)(+) transhydrogenase (Re/Si-specific) subunit beta [Bacteroidetes bacterium]|nr:NAD(P)(+) transhydrogenase (Re/Si-specific) subunit beta [Bacteroidota bacterium]HET6243763.1 NAD(P)(+) transhydrogenase (Re/Si-specific) subunit beta [Bacteroidia bacterium]
MEFPYILEIAYLIASVTFVIGLKMLSHPDSARKGNLIAAFGMAIAIAATLFLYKTGVDSSIYILIIAAMTLGTVLGFFAAKKVKMTAMPEMVSIFNGMGGACAMLIGLIEFPHFIAHPEPLGLLAVLGGMVIGSVSFSGSIIAWAKLNGTLNKEIRLPYYNIINTGVMILTLGLTGAIVGGFALDATIVYGLCALALVYGVLFVIPIGGADMPVVISLLNSFTGVAAAFGGFLYGNKVMLTGGILVGSAGTILTIVMCNAMNRSLTNVIFGAFGGGGSAAAGAGSADKSYKDISISDTAVLMNYSKKVIIVPGYGLAVAQAQHVIHELETILEERGIEVKYAIHPVAGRMPGHMNVLLAESSVDYGKLVEMEEINGEFSTTDVVVVIGANDVVNPAAKTDPSSPIYGMPILDVDLARNIIINKRSMNAGYAGIDNDLFYHSKTSMLFGDAKSVLTKLVAEIKSM